MQKHTPGHHSQAFFELSSSRSGCDISESLCEKFSYVIGYLHESSQLNNISGRTDFDNGFHLVWVKTYSVVINNMPQELDLGLSKETFVTIKCDSSSLKASQCRMQSLIMFRFVCSKNEDIINVTYDSLQG